MAKAKQRDEWNHTAMILLSLADTAQAMILSNPNLKLKDALKPNKLSDFHPFLQGEGQPAKKSIVDYYLDQQ